MTKRLRKCSIPFIVHKNHILPLYVLCYDFFLHPHLDHLYRKLTKRQYRVFHSIDNS